MKHILIPTDFSDNAINALHYAIHLMEDETCTFFLLNTYTPTSLYTSTLYEYHTSLSIDLGEIYKNTSEQKLQRLIDNVNKTFSNDKHTFEKIASCNMLVNEIVDLTASKAIDFIVMGTQGASGLKEIFIGSQTMHTIKKTSVPLLCVPKDFTYKDPKDILFATDYNLSINNVGLSLIKDICTVHRSRLILLNAYYGVPLDEEQKEVKDQLDLYFKGNAHQFYVSDGMDVSEALEDFQSKHRIDLLVMVHNKHNFFENLLFTPVINRIAHHTQIPFLVIPAMQKK